MTSPVSTNNRRIAKNTLLLYFRMLLMIGINLYTSRVILQVLGVEDFGINNVVGGVITMLGFLTGSLAGASSRYITYDLGKGDMEIMKKTFGNILSIHLLLAGLVVVIGETIGLWFMTTQLQIPETRETAAFWVYQFSIISFVLSVISVPYNASIIAHEKMSAFAYISIVDAVLKLLIVYLLLVISYDKLIVYAALFCCIQIFDRIVYSIYCRKHFEETRSKLSFDKKLFKEIFAFAGWTMNGSLAVIGYTQGINVLLNIFFGPAVNAARGIAVQVQNVTRQFCTNFQMALNPQLTKSYATGDYAHMHRLLKVSSKFSFYLMLLISLPLMLEAPLILKWWLGAVPEHTVNFLRLILCTGILFALSNPIITAVHASAFKGKFEVFFLSDAAHIAASYVGSTAHIKMVVGRSTRTYSQFLTLDIVYGNLVCLVQSHHNSRTCYGKVKEVSIDRRQHVIIYCARGLPFIEILSYSSRTCFSCAYSCGNMYAICTHTDCTTIDSYAFT